MLNHFHVRRTYVAAAPDTRPHGRRVHASPQHVRALPSRCHDYDSLATIHRALTVTGYPAGRRNNKLSPCE